MLQFLLGPLVTIAGYVSNFFTQKNELTKQAESNSADILVAETKSESWFTSSARPFLLVSITCILILWASYNMFFRAFVAVVYGVIIPEIIMPKEIWDLFGLCFGVYTGARSLEKIIGMFTKGLK